MLQHVPRLGQQSPIRGRETEMAPNNAGGFGFTITSWQQLDRFLLLGVTGGTYYVKEQDLARQNIEALKTCVAEDGLRVVARIVEVSDKGLAAKNTPAIFALALCFAAEDLATKRAAEQALPKVCRIGTHLFEFNAYVERLRGRGRIVNRAVRAWYLSRPINSLALQLVKYQSRSVGQEKGDDGEKGKQVRFGHRDVLRLARPKPRDVEQAMAFRWATHSVGPAHDKESASATAAAGALRAALDDPLLMPDGLQLIATAEKLKTLDTAEEVAYLVREMRAPREIVPTKFLTEKVVWEALFDDMPITALLRTLGTLTRYGVLTPENTQTATAVGRLTDAEQLKRGRIHPLSILNALATYKAGRGQRSEWKPVLEIVAALERAFYASFGAVEPTGKRIVIAVDVSGSMHGTACSAMPNLAAHEVAAALALVTARVEPKLTFLTFDTAACEIQIDGDERLGAIVTRIVNSGRGGTDIAQPVLYATNNAIEADAFVILTDSETWAGHVHPVEALDAYRARFGIPARLVNVQMTSTHTSVRDPEDALTLEVIGADVSVPKIIEAFLREEVPAM